VNARALVLLGLLETACPNNDDDDRTYVCTVDADCPEGLVCSVEESLCRRPEDLRKDAGATDGGDAGIDDRMTCVPSGEWWWCYAATPGELEDGLLI
jgi:hypothetical protein